MNNLITLDNWLNIKADLSFKPNESTKLLPIDILNSAVSKIETDIKALTKKEAQSATAFLMGCYPEIKLVDPNTYLEVLRVTVQSYPHFVVKKAIEEITKKHKFLPNRAVVYKECERLMEEPRACLRHAKMQYELHERMKEQAAENKRIRDSWRGTSPEEIKKKVNEKLKSVQKIEK